MGKRIDRHHLHRGHDADGDGQEQLWTSSDEPRGRGSLSRSRSLPLSPLRVRRVLRHAPIEVRRAVRPPDWPALAKRDLRSVHASPRVGRRCGISLRWRHQSLRHCCPQALDRRSNSRAIRCSSGRSGRNCAGFADLVRPLTRGGSADLSPSSIGRLSSMFPWQSPLPSS